jgi:hypothetical protein
MFSIHGRKAGLSLVCQERIFVFNEIIHTLFVILEVLVYISNFLTFKLKREFGRHLGSAAIERRFPIEDGGRLARILNQAACKYFQSNR